MAFLQQTKTHESQWMQYFLHLFLLSVMSLFAKGAQQRNIGRLKRHCVPAADADYTHQFVPSRWRWRRLVRRWIYVATPHRAAYELCNTHAPHTINGPGSSPTMARLIRGKKENAPVWRRRGLRDSLQLNGSFLQMQKYKVVTGWRGRLTTLSIINQVTWFLSEYICRVPGVTCVGWQQHVKSSSLNVYAKKNIALNKSRCLDPARDRNSHTPPEQREEEKKSKPLIRLVTTSPAGAMSGFLGHTMEVNCPPEARLTTRWRISRSLAAHPPHPRIPPSVSHTL